MDARDSTDNLWEIERPGYAELTPLNTSGVSLDQATTAMRRVFGDYRSARQGIQPAANRLDSAAPRGCTDNTEKSFLAQATGIIAAAQKYRAQCGPRWGDSTSKDCQRA